jgi:hypothetical protein
VFLIRINTELLTKDYGEEVAMIWRKLRLKPRMEAITAHELAESEAGSHVEALQAAANTRLPVSREAAQLLQGKRSRSDLVFRAMSSLQQCHDGSLTTPTGYLGDPFA